ncbi:ABC transporter integral membrane type 1 [Penicillium coprophilum]|uniref:ABC transporter integral membrane type 1 n=1 Tax=Penicillium coprophilum TaxID=36646 RepID=UPI002390DC46|nr:ABC transporter integral membrane type 1 [Penicillium coprophilum]XP_056533706.1 ABC transporter integral membrane type 1 [Penicillium coprophilum]KAJ5163484.1 ABC transporter integral membrane type 1 [Penicillium coprophilum]KAJ5165732.1 ABC transporter integral membrane type 1 [Penicillium coprophilum]
MGFSQDHELIDEELSCINDLEFLLALLVTTVVVSTCILVVNYVTKLYVQTSRQMRILDIEAKAPLLSQFLVALGGISSIRNYGWIEDYQRCNQVAFDASQRPSTNFLGIALFNIVHFSGTL